MSHYEEGEAPVEFASIVGSTSAKIFIQQKYCFETLETMEKLLLKALREEDFGLEL